MTKRRGVAPERARTDDSLREEREKTDVAIAGDRKSAERGAESVVAHARTVADEALVAERKKADEAARTPAEPAKPGAVADVRATEDLAVRGQRASADTALRKDLAGRARALEALLVRERASTDAYLLTERERSDDDVDNRDDFLGIVAHDVRNLLNLVDLAAHVMKPPEGGEPEPYVVATAVRIHRYVARMNRLVGDLVDVTSIDAGKLAVEPVDDDLAALIGEAAEAFQPAALDKGVALALEMPEGALAAFFDHDRILQVLANLAANAIKFTPRGGSIVIQAEKVDGMVRVCMRDSGVGIPEHLLESIFERFWQVGKNDRRGLGLGLYISKCIMLSHRGRIWAESQLGQGSQLYFTLPTAGPGPEAETTPDATKPDATKPDATKPDATKKKKRAKAARS